MRRTRVITVANGTDALQIALMAVGVGAVTFSSHPSLLRRRRKLCSYSARSLSLSMSIQSPSTWIATTSNVGSRANVAMAPAPKPSSQLIFSDCRRTGLTSMNAALSSVVADRGRRAKSRRSLHGKRVGTLAPVTTTSFFPVKPLGCFGDGGAIFTDVGALAASMRSIRAHGQGAGKYETVRVGVNSRLDTLQAAILLAKIEVLEEEIARRDEIAKEYSRRLSDLVETPVVTPGRISAWAQYTIKTDRRPNLQQALRDAGVPTAVYYPKPMHLQSAYAAYREPSSFPVSEALCEKVLSLPLNAYASDEEVGHVCRATRTLAVRETS